MNPKKSVLIQTRKLLIPTIVLALLASGISIFLYCKHIGLCQSSFACTLGSNGVDGCKALGESIYSKVFDIPIAWFGIVYYNTLVILATWILLGSFSKKIAANMKRHYALISAYLLLIEFGVVVDLVLASINFFVLPVTCSLCLYTYICQLLLLALAIVIYRKLKTELYKKWQFLYIWLPAFGGSIIFAALLSIFMSTAKANTNIETTSTHTDVVLPLVKEEQIPQLLRELAAFPSAQIQDNQNVITQIAPQQGKHVVEIIEFADYNCGYCYRFTMIMDFLYERWPGRILSKHRFYPLDGVCNSEVTQKGDGSGCYGALTSYCVARLYPKKYASYHKGLFDLQNRKVRISKPVARTILTNLEVDFANIDVCAVSEDALSRLTNDLLAARAIDLTGTPTIVLNNRVLSSGLPNVRWFIAIIDALIINSEGQDAIDDFQDRHYTQK